MLKVKSNLGKVAMIVACLAVTSLMYSCHPAPQKLFDAIEQDDVQQVKALIAKRVDVNASKDNLTALSMAVKKGSPEVVGELLAAGADANHQFIVISSGGPAMYTALMYAVDGGHTGIVKALLAANADANMGYTQDRKPPLVIAVMNGNPGIVEALLHAGADVNAKDGGAYSALMAAADKGDLETIRLLLAAGVDVNAATKNIYDVTQSGLTALMFAAFNGHSEAIKLLLDAGADISLKSGAGNNVREISAYKGHQDIVRLIDTAAQK
ncbi:MAG: ankyrin repeat domain-containing protein [Bacteroidales bacterium]|jgi:serine/threonine-protein phosphatase 6 regulatory ankyrin repeat subunit B|nr:ankyrin repeat domain-containing protein [Bacteroidales bacterium]